MSPLHAELRESRERKGLTLEALHATTRLSKDSLEAIERGDFEFLPKTYIRLFLRTYATHVGMDPQYVLDRYEELVRPVVEDPQAPPAAPRQRPLSWGAVAGLAAGLILLGWAGVSVFRGQMPGGSLTNPRGFSSAPSVSDAPVEGPAESLRAPASGDQAPRSVVPDTASLPAATQSHGQGDTASTRSIPFAGLEQDSVMVLGCAGVEETWIDVSADGGRLFRGTVKPGEERTWTARERFYVVAGRSSGVQLSLQGKPLPRAKSWASEVLRMSITRAGVAVEQRPRSAPARSDTVPRQRSAAGDTGSGGQ